MASEFSDQLNLKDTLYELNSNIAPINLNNISLAGEVLKEIPKKEPSSEIINTKINENEEMLFFTYDEGTKPAEKIGTAIPNIIPRVSQSINNAIKLPPNMDQIDYSQFIASSAQRTQEKIFTLTFREVKKSGISKEITKELDVFPSYDQDEIYTDYGTGEVKLPVTGNDKNLNFKATVAAKNLMRTNFEISPKADEIYEIPVFEQERFNDIVSEFIKTENFGSYLLIDLGETLDTVSIEAKYSKKIYLDNKFRVAKNDTEYRYEFFLDVNPGNTLVRYMDLDGNVAEKILSIVRGELTYDNSTFVKSSYIEFDLLEENLLSKRNQILELDENKIKYFNTSIKADKIGINRFRIKVPKRDEAFRQYLEIDYGSKIYIGFDRNTKLKLPGEDFIPYIKNGLGISEDTNSCLIQINLTTAIKDFRAQATSAQDIGSMQIYYMDKDGTVSRELTGLSEKILISSSDYGSINMKIKNIKNEIEYHQTFCTDSLYLIENI